MIGPNEVHCEQSLSGLMQGLSAYLEGLAQHTKRLEYAIGDQRSSTLTAQENTIEQMQSLDYLRQALNDLTALTSILGQCGFQNAVTSETKNEIMKTLNMNDIKFIICKEYAAFEDQHDSKRHGDLDLF